MIRRLVRQRDALGKRSFYTFQGDLMKNKPKLILEDGSTLIYRHNSKVNPFVEMQNKATASSQPAEAVQAFIDAVPPCHPVASRITGKSPIEAALSPDKFGLIADKLTERDLPPRVHRLKPGYRDDLSPEEWKQAEELRKADPIKWTISALSAKFKVDVDIVRFKVRTTREYATMLERLRDEKFKEMDWTKKKRYIDRIVRRAEW